MGRFGKAVRERAWALYLETRSFRTVAERVGCGPRTVERWSSADRWVERAEAFDGEERLRAEREVRSASAARRKRLLEALDAAAAIARGFLGVYAKRLAKLQKTPEAAELPKPRDVRDLVELLGRGHGVVAELAGRGPVRPGSRRRGGPRRRYPA